MGAMWAKLAAMRKVLLALLTLASALAAPAQTATGLPVTRRPEPIVTPPGDRSVNIRSGQTARQAARPRKRAPKNPYAPSPYRAPKAPKDPFSDPYAKPRKAPRVRDPLASDPSLRPWKPPTIRPPYGSPPVDRRRKAREESYSFEPKSPRRSKSPYESKTSERTSGRLKLPPKPRTSKPPKLTDFPELMPEQPRQPKLTEFPKAPKAPKAPKTPGTRKSRKAPKLPW